MLVTFELANKKARKVLTKRSRFDVDYYLDSKSSMSPVNITDHSWSGFKMFLHRFSVVKLK